MAPSAPRKGSLAFVPSKHCKKEIPSNIKTNNTGIAYSYFVKLGMTRISVGESLVPTTVLEQVPMQKIGLVYYDAEDNHTVKEKAIKAKIRVSLDYSTLNHPRKNTLAARRSKPIFKEIPYNGTVAEAQEYYAKFEKYLNNSDFVMDVPEKTYMDIIGVTKGHGFTGPVKRRGVRLQTRKASQKRRHTGALGTREPGKLDFKRPLAGQDGNARRTVLNVCLLKVQKQSMSFHGYGQSTQPLIFLKGSVPGPTLRTLAVRTAIRKCI